MSKPINQIRLQQLTGSVIDLKPGSLAQGSAASQTGASHNDLEDVLKYFAQAISNIHGNVDFGAQTLGLFDTPSSSGHDLKLNQQDSSKTIDLTSAGDIDLNATAAVTINGNGASNFTSAGSSGAVSIVAGLSSSGTSIHLDGNAGSSATVQIDAGILDMDVTGAANLDAGGAISLDAAGASNFTTTSGALTLSGSAGVECVSTGGNITLNMDAATSGGKIHLDSEGTGASAIQLESAGGVVVDAAALVSIASSAGSIQVGDTLADGQTLKLGNNSSVEMIFTPSDTASSEKISLVNKAGTADDAIKIDAEAGGVTIAAGNDSLVLDADGTDADAILVTSAGGMSVSAVGVYALTGSSALMNASSGDVEIQSASGEIRFESHDAGAQMTGGYINLATSGEFATFVGKDAFGAGTSIIGALNALADAGEPTKFVQKVTGSAGHAAGKELYFSGLNAYNYGGHTTVAGYLSGSEGGFRTGTATSIAADLEPHRVDVFLNGQLLLSGSGADVTAATADYHVSAANRLKFAFALSLDDIVQVVDRS